MRARWETCLPSRRCASCPLIAARSCCASQCWAPRGTQALQASLFAVAYPAPECALVVLQLSQALRRLRRGSVLRFDHKEGHGLFDKALRRDAQGQAPFQKFKAAYVACAL